MFKLKYYKRLTARLGKEFADVSRTVIPATAETASTIAAIHGISASRNSFSGVVLVHHHRNDYSSRCKVDNLLDLRVVTRGHSIEAGDTSPLHRHHVMHGSKPVHLTVFAVNPYEIHSGGAGNLGNRTVGERHAAAVCNFPATHLIHKIFKIIQVHHFTSLKLSQEIFRQQTTHLSVTAFPFSYVHNAPIIAR
jgi:hypothetical protein